MGINDYEKVVNEITKLKNQIEELKKKNEILKYRNEDMKEQIDYIKAYHKETMNNLLKYYKSNQSPNYEIIFNEYNATVHKALEKVAE